MPACAPERGKRTPTFNGALWARRIENGALPASNPAAPAVAVKLRRVRLRRLAFDGRVMRVLPRQTRCAPLPLVGRGWGWGYELVDAARATTTTPLPNPPPQGGREHTEIAARTDSIHSKHALTWRMRSIPLGAKGTSTLPVPPAHLANQSQA